jgi:hypothetical protein
VCNAIYPAIDKYVKYVRETWAALIKAGYDAIYSTALNFMLLIAIMGTIAREPRPPILI